MNKMLFPYFIFMFLFLYFSQILFGKEIVNLNEEQYFYRLSYFYRGKPPTAAESKRLKMATMSHSLASFYQTQVNEWIHQEPYVDFMYKNISKKLLGLNELTPLQTFFTFEKDRNLSIKKTKLNSFPSLDYFIFEHVKYNRSWDNLLLGKSYLLTMDSDDINFKPDEFSFYQEFLPFDSQELDQAIESEFPFSNFPDFKKTLIMDETSYFKPYHFLSYELKFNPSDFRIAGIITTPRFFNKFQTTGLNKHRRRSAFIFKTFLCDAMSPAVPRLTDKGVRDYIDIVLNKPSESRKTTPGLNTNDQHGNNSGCESCHYKLDSMAGVFGSNTLTLSQTPFNGSLAHKDDQGKIIYQYAQGIGDLAKIIVNMRQYESCQINYFWEWVMGNNFPLTDERREEVIGLFNSVGRRTNDFVAALTLEPEFKQRIVESDSSELPSYVQSIFKRCHECHKDQYSYNENGGIIPDFSRWPIGDKSSKFNSLYWLKRISERLDLQHMGTHRIMPPAEANWTLSPTQYRKIKDWLIMGAPDTSGNKQIPEGVLP